jgi:glycosyltransferase involved in cell wall biosynthesis
MKNDLITIIITNYKNETYLKNAISSCLKQTYKNIEIIVIDDASNSNFCLSLIKKINDNRIKLYHTKTNYGHYACCNFAIDISSGKYITFLGADDYIVETHIDKLYNFLVKKDAIATYCLYQRFGDNGYRSDTKICEASIMFNKNEALSKAGYFHMVRGGADTEYRMRLESIFGKNKILLLKECNYFALYKHDSLSRGGRFGRNSIERKLYIKFFLKNIKDNKLFYNYKNNKLFNNINNDFYINNFNIKNFVKLI